MRPEGVREGHILPFTTPIDTVSELTHFSTTESRVVRLSNLPTHPNTTLTDIHNFVAIASISAASACTQLWMIKNSSEGGGKPEGTGFLVFNTHADAKTFIGLNGRIFFDRAVAVIPSSNDEFLQVAHLRASFNVS